VQKLMLPAVKSANHTMMHPSALWAFMTKHRAFAIAVAVSFTVLTAMSLMEVYGLMNPHVNNAATHELHAEGNTVTTHVTTSNQLPNALSDDAKTSVTVNNQPIDVPKNGTVSKSITNENGTTRVNISNNTSSSGNSNVSSTSLNVNASTYSNNVNLHSP
jgi:hypothetical protein